MPTGSRFSRFVSISVNVMWHYAFVLAANLRGFYDMAKQTGGNVSDGRGLGRTEMANID